MTENESDKQSDTAKQSRGWNKTTEFGEPLWLDVLKSVGSGLLMLLITIIVGGALGVAIMAPWGRASHDCSIYCVLERHFDSYFSSKPE